MTNILKGLTQELYSPDMSPGTTRAIKDSYLNEAQMTAYKTASDLDNSIPRPPQTAFWDPKLKGTGTIAWYLDPKEVLDAYPREGRDLVDQIGYEPIIAFTPDLIYKKDKEFAKAVARHEGSHGGQPGKMILKSIMAFTKYGMMPLGEAFLEGSNEWALERRGMKPPSKYMEEEHGKKPTYGLYLDMVKEMEAHNKGIVRQVYRAATRGGPNAVIRLLESTPHIGDIINKYAGILSRPTNFN